MKAGVDFTVLVFGHAEGARVGDAIVNAFTEDKIPQEQIAAFGMNCLNVDKTILLIMI